jgi:Flp pilus assembly protein TadD
MNRRQPRAAGNPDRTPAGNPPRGTATAAVQAGVADLLAAGLAHHRAGRLAEAEVHYRRILPPCPNMPMPYTCLGVIACQVGRHEMAIELIGQAIQQTKITLKYYL